MCGLAVPPAALDSDSDELTGWRQAKAAVLAATGPARVRQILDLLAADTSYPRIARQPALGTPGVNTIPAERQPAFPGKLALEERLASLMRWNALPRV